MVARAFQCRPGPVLVLQPVVQCLPQEAVHTEKISWQKESVGNRAETVRALLESATIGSLEHVALFLVQTLEDKTKPFIEKLRLLWCTPSAHEFLVPWKLRDWMVHLIVLEKVWQE